MEPMAANQQRQDDLGWLMPGCVASGRQRPGAGHAVLTAGGQNEAEAPVLAASSPTGRVGETGGGSSRRGAPSGSKNARSAARGGTKFGMGKWKL